MAIGAIHRGRCGVDQLNHAELIVDTVHHLYMLSFEKLNIVDGDIVGC